MHRLARAAEEEKNRESFAQLSGVDKHARVNKI